MTDARQGHAYMHMGRRVISLESGEVVRVAEVRSPWLGEPYRVRASWLKPMPMVYFHGEVPR